MNQGGQFGQAIPVTESPARPGPHIALDLNKPAGQAICRCQNCNPKPSEMCVEIDYDKLADQLAKDPRFRGPIGPRGDPGSDGKPGADGIAGRNGVDGRTPTREEISALILELMPKLEEPPIGDGDGRLVYDALVFVGNVSANMEDYLESARGVFDNIVVVSRDKVPPYVVVSRYPTLIAYDSSGNVSGFWDGERDVRSVLYSISQGELK